MKPRWPILIVDDDESYRAILRHHLEALGYEDPGSSRWGPRLRHSLPEAAAVDYS